MKAKRLPDFWWLRTNGRTHKYVCPLLMTLSAWTWRLRGKPAYWKAGERTSVVAGHSEMPCLFPRSWIVAECAFWNSRFGTRLRLRGIGKAVR